MTPVYILKIWPHFANCHHFYVSVLRGRAVEVIVSPACCTNSVHILIKYVPNRLFIVNKNIFLQIIHAWHQTNTQKITWWISLLPVAKYFHIRPYIFLKGNIVYAVRARENRISFGPRPKFRNWDWLETAKSPKISVPYWPNTKEIFCDSVRYLGYSQILNLPSSDVNTFIITHD